MHDDDSFTERYPDGPIAELTRRPPDRPELPDSARPLVDAGVLVLGALRCIPVESDEALDDLAAMLDGIAWQLTGRRPPEAVIVALVGLCVLRLNFNCERLDPDFGPDDSVSEVQIGAQVDQCSATVADYFRSLPCPPLP